MKTRYYMVARLCGLLAWLIIGLCQTSASAREVVAGYRNDYQSDTMPTGWSYMWNAGGDVADPANYALLEADGVEWDTDASNPGQPDPAPGSHLQLHSTGGHPGTGNPDRYAIAAFNVSLPGHYFITNSFITLSNTNFGGSVDGVHLRVHVTDRAPVIDLVLTALQTTNFNADLGLIEPRASIYVAVGENGTSTRDAFKMDFQIERSDSYVSSEYPAPAPLPLGQASPLSGLEILRPGLPKVFFFRKPENFSRQNPYDTWRTALKRLNGINAKVRWEEINWLSGGQMEIYTAQFSQDEPRELLLCHYNNEGMDPRFAASFPAGYRLHPMHWLYHEGTTLTAAVSDTNTVLTVTDTTKFRTDFGRYDSDNDDIVIVPTNEQGQLDWNLAEQTTLIAITNGNQLIVERGLFGTTATNHPIGSYVAPHVVSGPWGTANRFLWHANYSLVCPLDDQGRNAGDIMAEQFRQWFAPGGPLEYHHGIGFDVPPWDNSTKKFGTGRLIDVDLDGQEDGGVLFNENVLGLGLYDFYLKLRATLGTERIITCDSAHLPHQKAVGLLDGMEAESFSGLNDPYLKSWSERLNVLRYWHAFCPTAYPMSYVVDKIKSDVLADPPLNLHRIQLATISILGAVTACAADLPPDDDGFGYGIWDELVQGTNKVANWLGAPVGPVRRLGLETPDLLGGDGIALPDSFVNAWTSSDAMIARDGAALRIDALSGENGPSKQEMSVTMTNVTIGSGDLLIRFETKCEKLTHFPADVPRWLFVTVDGRQPSADTADELFAWTGSNGWAEAVFYYRDAGPATVDIGIRFEGRQDVWLRNITVHNAADTMAREFERGVLLANPSVHSNSFDLATLFPGTALRRIMATPAQDTVVNNGLPVGATVTLDGLDGLFLLKDGADLDNDALDDEWEIFWSGTLARLGDPGTDSTGIDSDGDGQSDSAEMAAGTDPLDPRNRFQIVEGQPQDSDFQLTWSAIADHSYRILYSTNLIAGWHTLPGEHAAGASNTNLTVVIPDGALPESDRFFFAIQLIEHP
ncbi:MAG: thrombospondin type 3 repeat-containing protein [Kiritimatiellales bacterium]|nr:thrombospondin type 3 repeat-containing protein [Kiritimatiellales bacterium]